MRRSHLVVGAIAILLAILLVWKLRGGHEGDTPGGGGDDDGTSETSKSGGEKGTRGKNAQAPASIGGKVTRAADGSPVPNATVAVSRDQLIPIPGRRSADDEPSILATTDAKGEWNVPTIAAGSYSVGATAAGLIPGSKLRVAVAANERTVVDLALVAGGATVSGMVADVGGGPIGGARVTASKSSMSPFGGRAELVTVTGPDGKYVLNLGDGEYSLTATHEDYTRLTKRVELHGLPVAVDFTLAPGAAIRGIVVTRDGKPVPDARVTAETGRMMRDGGAVGRSDDKGAFALTSLPSGAIKLSAAAKGYASASPTVVELGVGEQLEGVRIVVDRAFSISGRVVRTGKPDQGIAGILVGCFSMGGSFGISDDPTEDTGEFAIHGLKPASYMLFAVGEGSVPDIGKAAEIVDKDLTGIVIELDTGVVLSGKVDPPMVASLGLEVDEDKMSFGNMFGAMKAMIVRGDSDATGAFTLRAAPPGTFDLVATTSDGRKGKLAVTVTTADQTGLVVKLEPRASIAGKVVDEKGAVVAGVRVNAVDDDKGRGGFQFRGGFGGNAGALSALDGSFKIVGLEPGKIGLVVEDDYGRIPYKTEPKDKPQPFELTKAQELTGVTLTVESRDGVIKGVVINADKSPAADAWVSLRPDSPPGTRREMMASFMRPSEPVLTSADGTFSFTRLRRGSYTISVEGPKGASRASKSNVKTGETVTLVLEALGSITGRVTLAGAPMTEFDVSCRPEERGMRFGSDSSSRRFTNADGTYQIERLQPGEYTCSASTASGTATGKTVVASGPSKLDLSVQAFATITGTVVDTVTGKPVPGLLVFATGDGVDGKQFMDLMSGNGPTTDASGKFVVGKIPAGKGQIHVAPKDATMNRLATRDYTAVAGQRIDLGTMKIVPPRDGASGTYGFFPMVTGEALMVGDVKDDMPAAKAGLVEGDKITAIDGRPVAELTADVGKQLLMPGAVPVGTRVALTLERAGQPVNATMIAIEF